MRHTPLHIFAGLSSIVLFAGRFLDGATEGGGLGTSNMVGTAFHTRVRFCSVHELVVLKMFSTNPIVPVEIFCIHSS